MKTLLLLLLFIGISATTSSVSEVHPDLDIEDGYNIHEAPLLENGQPLPVNFSINLRNVLGVNEKEQLISLETSLRMFWKDPRVRLRSRALERAGAEEQQRDYITLNPRVRLRDKDPDHCSGGQGIESRLGVLSNQLQYLLDMAWN